MRDGCVNAEDARVEWIENLARQLCDRGVVDGYAEGAVSDVLDFLDNGLESVLVIKLRASTTTTVTTVTTTSAAARENASPKSDSANRGGVLDDITNAPGVISEGVAETSREEDGERCDATTETETATREIVVVTGDEIADGSQDPVLFIVRSDDDVERLSVEALTTSLHGYYSRGACFSGLNATLKYLFAPALAASEESVNRSFAQHVQGFLEQISSKRIDSVDAPLTSLPTETRAMKTVDPGVASEDEEYVSQIEGALTEWCAVMSATKARNSSEKRGLDGKGGESDPIGEIRIWRARHDELLGLITQLKDPCMTNAVEVLREYVRKRGKSDATHRVGQLVSTYSSLEVDIAQLFDACKDNVKFLLALESHFKVLAEDPLSNVLQGISPTLRALRMIWTISHHYNDDSRMGSLLMSLSELLVRRVRSAVRYQDLIARVVHGERADAVLEQVRLSSEILKAWKSEYFRTRDDIARSNRESRWEFDRDRLFARTDHAAKLCDEFIEMTIVVKDLKTFLTPRLTAMTLESDAIVDISERVDALCLSMEISKVDAFEPTQQGEWKSTFKSFTIEKSRIENALCSFIDACFKRLRNSSSAFELVRGLKSAMESDVESSCVGSTHKTLSTQILSKTQDVLEQFSRELDAARHAFNARRRFPPTFRDQPEISGSINWVRTLFYRLRLTMRLFSASMTDQPSVKKTPLAQQVEAKFRALAKLVMNYEKQRLTAWKEEVESSMVHLTQPILKCGPNGDFVVNFNPALMRLIKEARNLERLGVDIPQEVRGVALQSEKYATFQCSLTKLLERRRSILNSLTPLERELLNLRIKTMNSSSIHKGCKMFNWNSLSIPEFLAACVRDLDDFEVLSKSVRANASEIERIIEDISNHDLFKPTFSAAPDQACDSFEFLSKIAAYSKEGVHSIRTMYSTIMRLLLKIEETTFGSASGRVESIKQYYAHWEQEIYCTLVNAAERAIFNIQDCFDQPSISGASAFKVKIVVHAGEITCEPPLSELVDSVRNAAKSIVENMGTLGRWMDGTCVEFPPRQNSQEENLSLSALLAIQLGEENASLRPMFDFSEEIMAHDRIQRAFTALSKSTELFERQIGSEIERWKSYQDLWRENTSTFAREYKDNRNALQLHRLLMSYDRIATSITRERGVQIAGVFIQVQEVTSQIEERCKALTLEVMQTTCADDNELVDGLLEKLDVHKNVVNGDIDDLATTTKFLHAFKDLQGDTTTETLARDINACFDVRSSFGYAHSDEDMSRASSIESTFTELKMQSLDVLKKCRATIEMSKSELARKMKSFKDDVGAFRARLRDEGPTSAGCLESLERGQSAFESFREEFSGMLEALDCLREEESVFGVAHVPIDNLDALQNDFTCMLSIFACRDAFVDKLKLVLQTCISETSGADLISSLIEVGRAAMMSLPNGFRSHKLFIAVSKEIEAVETNFSLIDMMKMDSIRPRHWEKVFDVANVEEEMDLSKMSIKEFMDMKLDEQAEQVRDVVAAAEKEQKIENDLSEIDRTWKETRFDIRPYAKSKNKKHSQPTHVLCSVEDITLCIEDTGLTLQSMAASRYVDPFIETVREWQEKLALVANVLQVWMDTQQRWMYLLSIFGHSDDIRMQLPKEADRFDNIDSEIRKLMSETLKTKFVLETCKSEGRFETLTSLRGELEICQKSLSQYLDTKRDAFPRFFFISDEELLSILGASDPVMIQEHMLKLFDNCAKLLFSSDKQSVVGIVSAEGESFSLKYPVKIQGPVECWMDAVEKEIKATLKSMCKYGVAKYMTTERAAWIKEQLGMITLVGSQIWWTWETRQVFQSIKSGDKLAMRDHGARLSAKLEDLTKMVRGDLSSCERKKVNTLIVIEVHARDIIESFVKDSVLDETDFAWESQLKFKWDRDAGDIVINQCKGEFRYGYEYMGLNGRLVITGLTDRCYVTLTTALTYKLGGAPSGPAGTGKTETTKDLAKSMGLLCVVFNCGEGLDYKAMGAIFSGLVQCGAWGCFDEFNRIEAEVLSVVSSQIKQIQEALKANVSRFQFEGKEIKCDPRTGVFITMNPGYAGRTELPDNLKALFRPVTMIVPDLEQICEIMLFSEGFNAAKTLARKMTMLYRLAREQLSKQSHYDFGLRALKSVLVMAGSLKRDSPELPEDVVLMRALRDMNLPKFVFDDVPLFLGLVDDLFPGLSCPRVRYESLNGFIERDLEENGYEVLREPGEQVDKIVQLYETMLTRHTTMLVGGTGGGKTVMIETIARAQSAMGRHTKLYVLNPKAQNVSELYGELDPDTRDWTDGLLSNIFRDCNKPLAAGREKDFKYIVFDGDVDAVWVENMNSVMDDNRLLTLPNGERIRLQDHCKLLFEVADLKYASPATVSRCGMVYVDPKNLGYKPFLTMWNRGVNAKYRSITKTLCDKYMAKMEAFCFEGVDLDGNSVVPPRNSLVRPIVGIVKQFCALLGKFLDDMSEASAGVDPDGAIESAFVFSLVWSFGATIVDVAGNTDRLRFDAFVRRLADREDILPSSDSSLYEFGYDIGKNAWFNWDSLTTPLNVEPETSFASILVSTAHTVRTKWLIDAMYSCGAHSLLTGNSGTSKTVVIKSYMQELSSRGSTSTLTMNFSSRTTANDVHRSIMDVVEKRTKNTIGPPSGKRLLCFMDDLNMPSEDKYGTQQPIALLKLMIGREGTFECDRDVTWLHMKDIQYIAAMGHPSGSRGQVDPRFISMFHVFEMQTPDEANLKVIYGSIMQSTTQNFDISLPMRQVIVDNTLDLFQSVTSSLLPTPSRFHYVFNLRDLSRLFEGISKGDPKTIVDAPSAMRLWRNESLRVFHDRLISDDDRRFVTSRVDSLIRATCVDMREAQCVDEILVNPIIYADHSNCALTETESSTSHDGQAYRDVGDYAQLKPWFERAIEDYNASLPAGSTPMQVILFDHALEHLNRIHRVLQMENGHVMLVGGGGSGKRTLARLAAQVAGCSIFEVTLTRGYSDGSFRDDLKKLYHMLGIQNKPTVFLFTENHIVEEGFLELINNMLTTGTVPALFADDEKDTIISVIREDLHSNNIPVTRDEGWQFFMSRCRRNLHIVLAMSPVGDELRNRCRSFPGLVNNTVIDWFTEWPKEALFEVSSSLLAHVDLPTEFREKIISHTVFTHEAAVAVNAEFKAQLKRHNYVTPKHFIDFIRNYENILVAERSTIDGSIARLSGGLDKLIQASTEVDAMRAKLNQAQQVVTQQTKECDDLLERITSRTAEVETKAQNAEDKENELTIDSERIAKEKIEAEADLEAAIPALEEAALALNNLKKDEITEIRSFAKPNIVVQRVCECVMILKGLPNVSWNGAKAMMADTNFLRSLVEFEKDGIKEKQMKAIREYTKDPKFKPEEVMKISTAGAGLLKWVFAMINYNKVARMVNPKRLAVEKAEKTLKVKGIELVETKAELKSLKEELATLSSQFEEKSARQRELKESAELMAKRLSAAERLIVGLSSEKERWTRETKELQIRKERLVCDCLLTCAFLSYAGPLTFEFRKRFIHDMLEANLLQLQLPLSQPFTLQGLLTTDNEMNSWRAEGLPSDELSVQNGILTTRAERFPLCIDPQMQASKWIKAREGASLEGKVRRQSDPDFLKQLELAIEYGLPFLIENVGEYIDPVLDPVLKKSFHFAQNGAKMIKLGDSEIEWDDNFRLYLTTKLPNPHYDSDATGKLSIINYSVTQVGLQEQLLNVTVKQERPDLEDERERLVKEMVQNRDLLSKLEDTLLQELSEAQGEILDNLELIETLENTKAKSIEISEKLVLATASAKELNDAQLRYLPVAKRGAILFFVITSLSNMNSMYEYSLASFLDVFCNTLESTPPASELETRLVDLVDRLTYDVYKFACLGMFKRDKLALSFAMATHIEQGEKRLNSSLLNFFLKGCVSLDNAATDDKTATTMSPSWWSSRGWQDLTHLDRCAQSEQAAFGAFRDLRERVAANDGDWREWYESETPEIGDLPGSYSLTGFDRLCLLRCARLDRVTMAVSHYVSDTMDDRFVAPPISDYEVIYNLSSARTPVVFILSPGADPAFDIFALGESKGFKPGVKLKFMALGQGMGPKAEELVETCASRGLWLMLQNCHLLPKWLPTLEKIVDGLAAPHKDFRLWLTTDPIKNFPIGILQRSLKVVTEPPDGLKMNMKASYARLAAEVFDEARSHQFGTLAYVLAFFHAVVQERRKYGKLGWNVAYDFNETDFRISFSLLKSYCDGGQVDVERGIDDTLWMALKYLIGEAMYGGRVSDDYDRRILRVYLEEYFGDFLFDSFEKFSFHRGGGSSGYELPDKPLSMRDHLATIDNFPSAQTPEVLGLHSSADVAHSTFAAKALWSQALSLQTQSSECATPTGDADANGGDENVLLSMAEDILKVVLNKEFEFDMTRVKHLCADRQGETFGPTTPTTVVLYQELERHNALKDKLERTLRELIKALTGEIGMSPDLEAMTDALSRGRLPEAWKSAAPPTEKDLQSWMTWYKKREKQFKDWVETGEPKVIWLSGLHCPETYIAALIQRACRKMGWPLDASAAYTEVTDFVDADEIQSHPEIGCYISGLFLEGAVWDRVNRCLAQPSDDDKSSSTELPILRLSPALRSASDSASSSSSSVFKAPVYFTQSRRDAMGRGLVFEADLASNHHSSVWTLRGVALCLNID